MGDQYGFHFDAKLCTGCKTCMLACKDYCNLDSASAYRQVYEMQGGGWTVLPDGTLQQDCFAYYVSLACNHCARPACMEVCPTGAMHRGDFGLVSVDERRCIGCGYCALSCPYHAPKVDRLAGHSAKCDGCAARVREGKAPICVEACPVRALDFGPMAELRKRLGACADLPPLPASGETDPNLAVTLPACAEGRDVAGRVSIANLREIV